MGYPHIQGRSSVLILIRMIVMGTGKGMATEAANNMNLVEFAEKPTTFFDSQVIGVVVISFTAITIILLYIRSRKRE